jgi:hypothetical protein
LATRPDGASMHRRQVGGIAGVLFPGH